MSVYSYPAPCAPNYQKPKSVDDCLPQARKLVKKIAPSEKPRFGVAPRMYVKPGDHILVVTMPDQDKFVAQAMTQALEEQGAKQVDYIYPKQLIGRDPDITTVEEGWQELELLLSGKASGTMVDLITGLGLTTATSKYLDKHPEYTSVFIDVAGGNARRGLDKHADKFYGFWPFNTWEWFFARGHSFPLEVWDEFEKKTVEPLGQASAVRITDPEGTFIEYSLTPDEAARWRAAALLHGHLFMNPMMATCGETREPRGENVVDNVPVFQKANGVLAGTSNHCGFFPRIEVHFEQDRVVEVRGGGKYGERIRETMDKFKNLQWPGYPGKGLFWYVDTALCTAIGVHRRVSDMFKSYWIYPNLPERTRAGIFHQGFGSRSYQDEKSFAAFATRAGAPRGHIHVHNYFATFEVKIRGTNYWHKIVDKGWMTALDDPAIRAMTTKYGNPDDLLKYDWIPPLPGINCAGDYSKDYAPDPVAYLKKRLKAKEPI
ncbi:MAG: hypothetical protein HYY29_00380 [Chloroflexi bacterium]|nr:hypothetical protein [Chloroflexota bacterium]